MSMLSRYKKKGGFMQLLNLIETCGAQKQEKFLKMIEEEDARWAEAIKQKMISVKTIFTWDDNTVAEIVARLNDLAVATALHALDPAAKEKAFKMMAQSRKKKIEDLMTEKTPSVGEISSIFIQILTEVRALIQQGYVYIEKIDPNLVIDPDIEEKLSTATLYTIGQEAAGAPVPPAVVEVKSNHTNHAAANAEIESLKRKLNQLMNENHQLKEKLSALETKLTQIRKYAA